MFDRPRWTTFSVLLPLVMLARGYSASDARNVDAGRGTCDSASRGVRTDAPSTLAHPAADQRPEARLAENAAPIAMRDRPADSDPRTPGRFHARWKARLDRANQVVKSHPGKVDGYLARARLHLERRAYEATLDEVEHALTIDPKHVEARRIRATCLGRVGSSDKAREEFNRLLQERPRDSEILTAYAAFQHREGAFLQALLKASEAVNAQPRVAKAFNTLGMLLLESKREDEAWIQLNEATKLDPDYAPPYHNRAVILARIGNYPAALDQLDRATELDPTYAPPYRKRKEIFETLGWKVSAFHEERILGGLEMVRKMKTQFRIPTLEISVTEVARRTSVDLERGPFPRSQWGWPLADVLLWAAIRGDTDDIYQATLVMLAEGADVNRVDVESNETLLHICVKNDLSALVVRQLLLEGADDRAKNRASRTPIDLIGDRLESLLPGIEAEDTRVAIRAFKDSLAARSLMEVTQDTLDKKIERFLDEARAERDRVNENAQEYAAFRSRMRDVQVGMAAAMSRRNLPGDNVDPLEAARVGAQLVEDLPPFQSQSINDMMIALDSALWHARHRFGRNHPRYLDVLARSIQISDQVP
ncbi:MAG: hypothetical protein AB7I30_09075 [Isosphaeraceae bacterium]